MKNRNAHPRSARRLESLENRNLLTADVGLPGDLDLNGAVEFEDFSTLAAHFGQPAGWSKGDLDGDGTVGFRDFLMLAKNFGQTAEYDDVTTVNWEKTLDPMEPGAVWVGQGQTADGSAVSVRAFDLQVAADGQTIDTVIFEIYRDGQSPVSLQMAGKFTPGEQPGTGAIELHGERNSVLNSTTANGLVTTAGTISYTDDAGETVEITWEKTLDPFNPMAVWAGPGTKADGTAVNVRAFDFVLGQDGTTIEKAIFEVLEEGQPAVSLRISGKFTPGEAPGTGSIFLAGEQASTLRSTTENGVVTSAGSITYHDATPIAPTTVTWEKTLDPMEPGAVWKGPGQLADGTEVHVRAFDLQVAADGQTIDTVIFEVNGPGEEVVSLQMAGKFTPGELPGTGAIELHGERGSVLNSTTTNGLVTTAGTISYTDDAGQTVTVNWEKTLDPFNPNAVWAGPGQLADGTPVRVRANQFRLASDGTTIERATFEVFGEGQPSVSLHLSGHFTPGEQPGSGSIYLAGDQGAVLQSTTTNGVVTTSGYITFADELLTDQTETVTWSKTLDPMEPGAVWVGPGETADGQTVHVRAFDLQVAADGQTIDTVIFEITGEGRDPVSLQMAGQFMPGEQPGTGAIELHGQRGSVLNSTTTNGLVTTTGTITYVDANGETVSIDWTKTLDPFNPLAVWAGPGTLADGTEVDVRAFDFALGADGTTIERAVFEVHQPGHDTVSMLIAGTFTPGETPGTGSIFLAGEQASELNSTTENGVVTSAGTITYQQAAPVSPLVVNWTKTLDPMAAGGVWVGAGTLDDGTEVAIRAFDLQLAADGQTIETVIFEIRGEGRETVSLQMQGAFTPGATAGTGSIAMTGERNSTLNSTTVNGLVTTTGTTTYTDDAGETVTVNWEKTLDAFNPNAVWSGAGQTINGEHVAVRLTQFRMDAAGAISKATFEIMRPGRLPISLQMAGQFTPGEVPGTGSIYMTGEQGAVLQSTTDNGAVTTSGVITLLDLENNTI